ncbi:uncharacterized protein LACBIDRAFT_316768 [Laccaria bicolor S238N-H82]|uniref:Predicted protein n=1 Tax=Laccaria bicolor (strain S238N-H82 / ATCC MYA-4686) TaxID=486041 RepID=B0E1K9_LACBS|nr:uncharacterized protein LACBIDRAFT_316768 [Laccaria bicolor S238N-H82]EDQ99258.1 predicted protein [Laccaria bicolor S238N-H82]|eukprot:XP_001890068.1 predicted protein [Laccaria bicolor S238N-H82]
MTVVIDLAKQGNGFTLSGCCRLKLGPVRPTSAKFHQARSLRGKKSAECVVKSSEFCAKICEEKRKFVEKGLMHSYCSRSCARRGEGPSPVCCELDGCRATGHLAFANFCSRIHAEEAVRLGEAEGCMRCGLQPRMLGQLCILCDRQSQTGPQLRELNAHDSPTLEDLKAQFLSRWAALEEPAYFEKAYEVVIPRDVRILHDRYRLNNPNFEEVRSFYSSQCICDLGLYGPRLCSFESCGICCIVKSFFKSFAFGEPIDKGRYGNGIYSYESPALADMFATSCTSSPYRVMVACDVIVDPKQRISKQVWSSAKLCLFTCQIEMFHVGLR